MRFILVLIALITLFVAGSASAAIPTTNSEYTYNRLPGSGAAARKYLLGTMLREAHNTLICVYDFALDGGAISTIQLHQTNAARSLCTLPAKAIIRNGIVDVVTAATSGGSATVALGLATTTDILAATAVASVTGKLNVVPVGTAVTAVKLAASQTLSATIATATLTAGKFRVFLDYVLSE